VIAQLRSRLWLAAVLALGACAPTLIERGPAVQAPALEAARIVAADGTELPLRRWLPEDRTQAAVVALHGFNDYSNAFAVPAERWKRAGIATYAYDQRGFGATATRGRWATTATLVDDLATAVALVRAQHPGTPVTVLGESMGGAVVMVAGAQGRLDDVEATVLIAPAVRGRAAFGPVASLAFEALAHTVPWLSGPSGSPGVMPTDNMKMLRAYSRDPLVIKHTRVDATWGLLNVMDEAVAAAPDFRLPALILLGARDTLVPDGPMGRTLAAMPAASEAQRRVITYANGWHMLLRDLDGDRVQADVAAWLLGERGSGLARAR
jgi:alpha-beta hydrolase superfamily lysophospholipase